MALKPANGEMPMRKALKVVHENHVDGGAANRTDDRQSAGGGSFGGDEAEARCDFGHEAADHFVEAALATPRSSNNAEASCVSRVRRAREA